MPGPTLHVFESVDHLAENLRDYILAAQDHALERHTHFRVAISGGSLPSVLAKALLPLDPAGGPMGLKLSQWTIFYADERLVPVSHPDSNHGLVRRELLDRLPASWGQPTVHAAVVAEGEDEAGGEVQLEDAQAVADAYEKALVGAFAARDSVRLPMFDLLLLGCGPDGHTCSLFPGHAALRETDAWVVPVCDSPKPPPRRITISLPVASHGLRVAFVATGEGKREVLRRIFEGVDGGEDLPCAMVNRFAGERVAWFVDTKAVEGIKYPMKMGSL